MRLTYIDKLSTDTMESIALPLLASCTLSMPCILEEMQSLPEYQYNSTADYHSYEMEASFDSQLTGGVRIVQEDSANYLKLLSFGNDFLQEIEGVPPEFEEVFKENYWDLLA